MKKIILLFSLVLYSIVGFTKPVDETTAMTAGRNFLRSHTHAANLQNASGLTLAYTINSRASSTTAPGSGLTYLYVFNTVPAGGFVIVSADDAATPVLGYSDEVSFNSAHIPDHVAKWLEGYKSQMQYIVSHNLSATPEIQKAWGELLSSGPAPVGPRGSGSVSPLLTTKWDQSPYYNALCPLDNSHNERTVTGCVATAMAQVMKYWNYPSNGTGFHSFNHDLYGTLSANFGSTAYDWTSMPNSITSSNTAVATLMYHCGVSVDMNYGIAESGGSGSYVIASASPVANCAEYALKTYFGYKSTLQGISRSVYTDGQWTNALTTELDNKRPVIYAGFGSGGGHCFVADGYDDNGYFHFNWGWSGAYNGYFSVDALNPGGVGTGGGTGGFNSGHQALIGVVPGDGSGGGGGGGQTDPQISLYNYVTSSASTIYYGQSFSITTNMLNSSTTDFSGDYCAAVFDANDVFVDYVYTYNSVTLASNHVYSADVTFPSSGMLSMLPGVYNVKVFYRPTGGNWIQISDYGSYTNGTQITVINPNNIELYAPISISGGTTLIKGRPVQVSLDVANYGSSTFSGSVNVAIYNLDGSFATAIELKNSITLPSNSHFNGGLVFNSSSLNLDPGSYYLAVEHENNGGNWQLTGSTTYQNPIKVTVQEAPIQPDKYEVNNTIAQSYSLPMNFVSGTAHITTVGSNCHTGSDYDYYKLELPAGYDYTITGRLNDLNSSTNGQTYTLDALVSYSLDGSTWSDTYDDIITDNISIKKNGGTVYLLVSPYFTGQTGTYELDLAVNRIDRSGIQESKAEDMNINIYPNPAHNVVNVDYSASSNNIRQVVMTDMEGRQLSVYQGNSTNGKVQIPLDNVSAGMYLLRLQTDNGTIIRKISVTR